MLRAVLLPPALLLVLLPAGAEAKTLCRTAAECASANGLCGSRGQPLASQDYVNLCLGFNERGQDSANGTKALFRVQVDKYSTLSVETLRQTMTASWDDRKPYEELWVGMRGMRTVGQQRGIILPNGDCNATDTEPKEGQATCFGWTQHNKLLVNADYQMATGLTAIIHLSFGVINRIVWDSSCNLCPTAGEISCQWDHSDVSCVGGGQCQDCYANLRPKACGPKDDVCSPKVYVAWLGTDKWGQPLLSAGSVLSRFAAYSVSAVGNRMYEQVQELGDEFDPEAEKRR